MLESLVAIIDDGEGRKKLARLRGRFSNYVPVMEGPVQKYVREAIREQFDTEGGHFGTPWAQLAKSTIDERVREGFSGQILQKTGDLYRSFVDENDPNAEIVVEPEGMVISSAVPYGIYHQSPEPRHHLPRREIVPDVFPQDFIVGLKNIITGYLIGVEFGA